jgi:hypothetical protein
VFLGVSCLLTFRIFRMLCLFVCCVSCVVFSVSLRAVFIDVSCFLGVRVSWCFVFLGASCFFVFRDYWWFVFWCVVRLGVSCIVVFRASWCFVSETLPRK